MRVDQQSALNCICPYFTMFPLSFPLSVLRLRAHPGEWVADPFSGRGTTGFAGRLLGMPSIAIDSSPVAAALSQAKIANTTSERIGRTARRILDEIEEAGEVPSGEFWEMAYDKSVLNVLCRLREGLLRDCRSESRRGLRAIVLGALHGPVGKRKQSYLSNQCPRTYAPKPRYAVSFWRQRALRPPHVDVMSVVEDRARRYYDTAIGPGVGLALCGDSRKEDTYLRVPRDSVHWVVTSPPYYGMRTYVADQWLRMWFVGGPARVDYRPGRQVEHSSPGAFAADLRRVWLNMGSICAPGARIVIRFGAINDRKVDPGGLIASSLIDSGWAIADIAPAGSAAEGRRQACHFTGQGLDPLVEFDLWGSWVGA